VSHLTAFSDLPLTFDELILRSGNLRIVDSVLDPVIVIARLENKYQARLSGRLRKRGATSYLRAASCLHSWVSDGESAYPLPRDIATITAGLMLELDPETLTYPQVLRLQRTSTEELEVVLDSSVLLPAKEEAALSASALVTGLNASLYDYQSRGVSWMRGALARFGGLILADEMGLGKTLQIICLMLLDRPKPGEPALIVCPSTLMENWSREIRRFAPSLSVYRHSGTDRARLHYQIERFDVVLSTYDTAVNDAVLFKAIKWMWLIFDEAQALKNPEVRRRKVLSEFNRKYCIPVTGTPVETKLTDLWSLSDLAVPGLLGTLSEFEDLYPDTESAAALLRSIAAPLVLRRTVPDVAGDLPERHDIDIPIEMTTELARRYERVRERVVEAYPVAGPMVATGQLQMFCAHPSLVSDRFDNDWEADAARIDGADWEATPKVERLVELVGEALSGDQKVLIFTGFNACVDLVRTSLRKWSGLFLDAINGSTPQANRQQIVDAFSEHVGPAVLVLNPRAAGAGLNIVAASVVIHFTQVWNPALEAQASARAHRRGQEVPVTVYHMYYVSSVEEIMIERSRERRSLGNDAIPLMRDISSEVRRALDISPVETA
jgi:SNF2 family DNA or RNA helicase